MSWQDDEIARREASNKKQWETIKEAQRIRKEIEVNLRNLWDKFVSENNKIKPQLRLELKKNIDRLDGGLMSLTLRDNDIVVEPGFFIDWTTEKGYSAHQLGKKILSKPFNEQSIEYIIRCMVTNTGIDFSRISKSKFFSFF